MVLTLLYTRTPTLSAALIRAMPPWGPWSHSALVLSDAEVIEALALRGGVVRSTVAEVLARSSAWMRVELDVPDALAAETWARETVGLHYDWLGVVGIPARNRGMGSPRRWYCSEHGAAAIERAGHRILTPGMHGLTPTHLAQLTQAAGHRVVATGEN